MATDLQTAPNAQLVEQLTPETLEKLILQGDLKGLTPIQRVQYSNYRHQLIGADPAQYLFEYITFQGKLVLYARKSCTDYLTSRDKIKVTITSQVTEGDQRIVLARATTQDGRESEDIGAVPIKGLMGDALANALKKAVTQAKRRVVLSVCGLGLPDESELDPTQIAQVVDGGGEARPTTLEALKKTLAAKPPAEPQAARVIDVTPRPTEPATVQGAQAQPTEDAPWEDPFGGDAPAQAMPAQKASFPTAPAEWYDHTRGGIDLGAIVSPSDLELGCLPGEPWHEWLGTDVWKKTSKLGAFKPRDVIYGGEHGGRHALLEDSVKRFKDVPADQVPRGAMLADWCLCQMRRRWAAMRAAGLDSTVGAKL